MNPVAQTFQSAVSRVFNPQAPSITDGPGNLNALEQTNARPTESRRYSRLKTCATEAPVHGSLHPLERTPWDHEPARSGTLASAAEIRGERQFASTDRRFTERRALARAITGWWPGPERRPEDV